ncbi:MAG: FAD-binding oxidoreductase, partial [Deferribacterota bacterium]|nr:FAD-binding oxidoreductase [Deferribacterota bacterium]
MKTSYNVFDELKEKLKGDLFTDALSRYLLSTDGSMYLRNPLGIVYPRDEEDVKNTIKFANNYNLAIHPRGAGSGLTGGSLGEGIVIDFTRYMNKLVELNTNEKYFICEPGFRGGELNKILENVNLYFPPDPSSFDYASFGGMFSTNASGAHSSKYGNISDYLLDADIILASGEKVNLSTISKLEFEELPPYLQEIYKLYIENIELIEDSYPSVKNNVSGYNLRRLVVNERLFLHTLFTGSEGTLGIVTKLKFKLIDKPSYDTLLVAYFNDIFSST